MKLKGFVLGAAALFLSGVVQAEPVRYQATSGWYKEMHGTKTIELSVDDDNNTIRFDKSPWFSGATEFTALFASPHLIIALSKDERTLLEVNFDRNEVVAGDNHGSETTLSFGKYLGAPIVPVKRQAD